MKYDLKELHWQQFEVLSFYVLQKDISKSISFIEGGNDGGRDLLFNGKTSFWNSEVDGSWVFQAKHKSDYKSGLVSLKMDLKKELDKIFIQNNQNFDFYVLVTNLQISAPYYDELNQLFLNFCNENNLDKKRFFIYGYRHFESCITENSSLKWLFPSIIKNTDFHLILDKILSSKIHSRQKAFLKGITKKKNYFVLTTPFLKALNVIESHKIILFSGPPKSGKTFNAEMIAFKYVFDKEYDLIKIDYPEEFEEYYDSSKKQLFLFDDAFGIHDFNKQQLEIWDRKLENLFNLIDENHKFIFTSREHIYKAFSKQTGNFSKDFFNKITVQSSNLNDNEKIAILHKYTTLSNLKENEKIAILNSSLKIVSNVNFSPESIRTFFVNENNGKSFFIVKKLEQHLSNPDEYIRVLFSNLTLTRKVIILSILCSAQNSFESVTKTFNYINDDINNSDRLIVLSDEIHILDEAIIKIDNSGEYEGIKFYHPTMVEYLLGVIKEPANSKFRNIVLKNINSSVLNLSYLKYERIEKRFIKNKSIEVKENDFDVLTIGLSRYLTNPTCRLNDIIISINWFKSMNITFLKLGDKRYYKKVKNYVKEVCEIIYDYSFYNNHRGESCDIWSEFLFSSYRLISQFSFGRSDVQLNYYRELLKNKQEEIDFWKIVFRVAIFEDGKIILKIINDTWLDSFIEKFKKEIYLLGHQLFEDDFPYFEEYESLKKLNKHFGYERLKNKPNKEYYPKYLLCKEKFSQVKLLKWNVIGTRIFDELLVPMEVLNQISEHAKNYHFHNKFMLDDELSLDFFVSFFIKKKRKDII